MSMPSSAKPPKEAQKVRFSVTLSWPYQLRLLPVAEVAAPPSLIISDILVFLLSPGDLDGRIVVRALRHRCPSLQGTPHIFWGGRHIYLGDRASAGEGIGDCVHDRGE